MRLFKIQEDIYLNVETIAAVVRVRTQESGESSLIVTIDDREFRFTDTLDELLQRIEQESIVV